MDQPLIWHFEDYVVGTEGRTHGRLVTDAEVAGFAALSGDYHPIHFDPAYGKVETAFGGRVAHGLIGPAVATGMLARDAPEVLGVRFKGHAFAGVEWRFIVPIRVGDTLYTRWRVDTARPTRHPDRGLVQLAITMENQDGAVLQQGRIDVLVVRREPLTEGAR